MDLKDLSNERRTTVTGVVVEEEMRVSVSPGRKDRGFDHMVLITRLGIMVIICFSSKVYSPL